MAMIMTCIFTPTLQCNIIEYQPDRAKVVEFYEFPTLLVKEKIATQTTL